MTKEGGAREKECAREGVQILFMDYLTCLGYNPPKASIRIIASSSSRLRDCYCLPFLDPSSLQGGGEREEERYRERNGLRALAASLVFI